MLDHLDEMCNTDATPPPGNFYVTIRRGARVGWLLGPYSDIRDALAEIPRARRLAHDVDSWTAFDGFGVSRLGLGTEAKTVFASCS